MNETPENIPEKDRWKHEGYENLRPKQIAALELLEHSQMSKGDIARAIGYNPAYFPTVLKKLEKHSLASPVMRKKAYKAVKETLEMQPHKATVLVKGEPQEISVYPTHTNRLAAAQMVADRCEPIVQRTESVSVSFSKIDLSEYELPPPPK